MPPSVVLLVDYERERKTVLRKGKGLEVLSSQTGHLTLTYITLTGRSRGIVGGKRMRKK